jgi:hypothetical protein
LLHRLCLPGKKLLEVSVTGKVIMCDAAGTPLIVVFELKNFRAVYPGDLQHLLDVTLKPLIELIDDLAVDTDRDLNYGPGGVCHESDCLYFFFAFFFFDAAFLRLLFFAAARFAGFFPGAFSTAGFFAFEPGSEF